MNAPNMITLATGPYHAQQHPAPPAPPVYAGTHIMQAAPLYSVCNLKLPPQYRMFQTMPPGASNAGTSAGNVAMYSAVSRQAPTTEVPNVVPPQILHYYPHPAPGAYHYPPHQMTRRSADANIVQHPHQSHLVMGLNGGLRPCRFFTSCVYF